MAPPCQGKILLPAVLPAKKGRPITALDKQIRSLLCQISLALGSSRHLDYALKHNCSPWEASVPLCVPQLGPWGVHGAELALGHP